MMVSVANSIKADSIKSIAGRLERSGYAVVQDFVTAAASIMLATQCRALHAAGLLTPAEVGNGDGRAKHASLRGDQTRWFDADALAPAQSAYWRRMQRLRGGINRNLMLGMEDLEAHYALYPIGTRYARHRDRFRDDDARVLSSVLYLNPGWHDSDGGALRLYVDKRSDIPHVDIYPEARTLVLFLSADFDHEVLPATRERLSIAGWFRRRAWR